MKDRTAETLLPLVRKYVRPNTDIFSDKWSAYFGLDGEFRHFFVVHQRRFVKYRLLQDGSILKVTTNHIKRVWVDLRKNQSGVPKEEIRRRVNEVPYRLMTFVPGIHKENLLSFFFDRPQRDRTLD